MARRILTAREQYEMLAPWRVAMPIQRIPPMKFDADLFNKQLQQLVYSDADIAGRPDRANTISSQGGSCTNTAGEPATMMSFIHHDERGAPTGVLHYFPTGSRQAREKPGGIQVLVHPAHQHKGVGTKLLNAALDEYGVDSPNAEKLQKSYDYTPIDLEEQQYTPSGYGLYRHKSSAEKNPN